MTSTPPQEITYSEIRKGDTIRVTTTYPSGLQNILVGIAEKQINPTAPGDRWLTSTFDNALNTVLASRDHSIADVKQVVHLVDRPIPALPTAFGTVIRITETVDISGTDPTHRLAILDTDGDWAAFSHPQDLGCEYFKPKDILSWNPVEITDLPHSNN